MRPPALRATAVALVALLLTACGGASDDAAPPTGALPGPLDPLQARARILAVYELWLGRLGAGDVLPEEAGAIADTTRRWIRDDGGEHLTLVRVDTARVPSAVRDPQTIYIYGPLTRGMFVVAAPTRHGPRFGVVDPKTRVVEVIGLADLPAYERALDAALGARPA